MKINKATYQSEKRLEDFDKITVTIDTLRDGLRGTAWVQPPLINCLLYMHTEVSEAVDAELRVVTKDARNNSARVGWHDVAEELGDVMLMAWSASRIMDNPTYPRTIVAHANNYVYEETTDPLCLPLVKVTAHSLANFLTRRETIKGKRNKYTDFSLAVLVGDVFVVCLNTIHRIGFEPVEVVSGKAMRMARKHGNNHTAGMGDQLATEIQGNLL